MEANVIVTEEVRSHLYCFEIDSIMHAFHCKTTLVEIVIILSRRQAQII